MRSFAVLNKSYYTALNSLKNKAFHPLCLKLTKKFDGVSQKIYEQTGKKINIGAIVGGVLLGAIILCIVGLILGMIRDFLFGVS